MEYRDFTVAIYRRLLDALLEQGYTFQPFRNFLEAPAERVVMLRHDVDARKLHSLQFARIQHEKGVAGTYFFRVVPQSFDEQVIREIEELGHEIGYHYEDMDFSNGDPHRAIRFFEQHLEQLRAVADVTTICMHGSPRSNYDNKDVWKVYDYRDYGIVGEPYFDLDFSQVYYLTDTGRMWDGYRVSVRDKVEDHFGLSFHTTHELIDGIRRGLLPDQIMINFHPQRWTDDRLLWTVEKYLQQLKNSVKYFLIKYRNKDAKALASEQY